MAITTMSMSLGGEPRRYSSGGLSLEEAEKESYLIRGESPPPVEEKPEEDARSPAQIYMDNQRERERQAEQNALNDVPSANAVLAVRGSQEMQIRMDVGEQIMAALPGKGIWDVKDNRPVFFTSDGKEFDGTDVANSLGAVENFVAATLGEEYRAIYSRSVTAPLDPAYRLQENAKGAANPVLAEMQNQGTISQGFSNEDIGVVPASAATGVTSEMIKAAPALLAKGIAPTDLMIQFGARLNDSKEFKELPDAAKVAVVRDLADKVDQADSVVVSKTLTEISNHFNQVEQDAEKEVAKTVADTVLDDLAPVDGFDRAALLKQTMNGVQEIRTLSKTLYAFPPEKILDTPWEIRQREQDVGKARLVELKQAVAKAHSRALRDQPQPVVDVATAALFDIDRDLISEGLSLDKLVSSLEDTGIDLAALSDGDRRKLLLGRAIDKWFVSKSKDPASAPVYSALRQKMLKTIAEGGKLDPNIENSVNGLVRQIGFASQQKSSKELIESRTDKYDKFRSKFQTDFYKKLLEKDDPAALLEENKPYLSPEDYSDYSNLLKEQPAEFSQVINDPKASRSMKKAAIGALEKESASVAATVAESLKFIRGGSRNTKQGLLKSTDEAMTAVVNSGLSGEHKAALLNLLARNNEISGISRGEFVDGYGFDRLFELHTAASKATGMYGNWTEFMDMYAALDKKLSGVSRNVTDTQKKEIVNAFIKEATDPLINRMRSASVSKLALGK